MKKLIFFLLLSSIAVLSYSQGTMFYVVKWDDTVTVRSVDKIRPDMIINSNYKTVTLPTGLDSNLELFLFEGIKTMPPYEDIFTLQDKQVYFLDSVDETSDFPENRLCGIQWVQYDRDSSEVFAAVDAIKAQYNNDILELHRQIEYLSFMVYYNYAQNNAIAIPTRLENLVPKIINRITKWWMNFVNSENKKDAYRNEENFDPYSGWALPDAE